MVWFYILETAEIYIESVSTTSLGLDEVDVSTRESANASLDMIHDASNKLSGQRAEIGAYFNRLQHKIDNLTVASQNLKASESYIRDIDMASEISNCIVNSILQDAGTALLSQANSIKQGILSLLS